MGVRSEMVSTDEKTMEFGSKVEIYRETTGIGRFSLEKFIKINRRSIIFFI
jgi:hypothetical protein